MEDMQLEQVRHYTLFSAHPPSTQLHVAAVQMSLHSLAVTFTKEMRSLQLSEEQVTYWNQFMGTRQDR